MDDEEHLEFEKLADLRHDGRLLRSLLEAVVGEYGLFIDDDVRQVYRWLREEIVFLEYALDEEFKEDHDLNLGRLMELAMPEEINDIDSGNNALGYSAADFVLSVRNECDNMESMNPRLVPLSAAHSGEIQKARDALIVIERIRGHHEAYASALKSGIEASLFSASISSIANDLTFEFVSVDQLRRILRDRVAGAIIAYESKRYMDAITGCLSVVEGVLVFGLERNAEDAQIDYAMRHPARRPLPSIERWGTADLITTAREVGLFRSKDIYNYCYKLNSNRNAVHVYHQLSESCDVDDRDAMLGFLVMSWLHDDALHWTWTQEA